MACYHLVLAGLLLAAQLLLDTVQVVGAQNTNFSFTDFSTSDSFLTVGDVQYSADNSSFLMNVQAAALSTATCGRVLYKDQVRMKDSASGAVASFHTAFTFQITGQNYWVDNNGLPIHGDGLAFTFASNINFTGQDWDGSLCLLKDADNGLASNRLFAVEFDTFYNYWYNDSSDSHIGVDIDSMNSTWSYNMCGGNVRNCSHLANGGYFTAWIDYDSASQKLDVFFANGSLLNSNPKPSKPVISASLALAVPLADLVDDYMYVGFSSSTGVYSEVHQIQSWTFVSSGMPDLVPVQPAPSPAVMSTNPASNSSNGSRKVGIIVGVSVGAVVALLVLGFFIARYRRASSKKQGAFSLVDQNLVPRMFTHKELSKATKNFSKSELLGSGGYGAVYKGTLPSGALVAVKRMRMESRHGEESFLAEAASLSRIRHKNLLQLKGWCYEEGQLLLVYDYMRNGSLDEWLFQFSQQNGEGLLTLNGYEALPLDIRHSVLSGVAAALSYLHEECPDQCVLHRHIKSSNVLLDKDLNAHLGDFGLVCVDDYRKIEKTSMKGYMAREIFHTGRATKESDVYSFGILMLEVMCGTGTLKAGGTERGESVLVDRVWRAHEAGNILEVADSKLEAFPTSDSQDLESNGEIELQEVSVVRLVPDINGTDLHGGKQSTKKQLNGPDGANMEKRKKTENLLRLGLLCCNPNTENRPSMRLVSQLLHQIMEMSIPLPICKPQGNYCRPAQEVGNAHVMEKLESYLKLAKRCVEAVQKMSNSWKFNNEQCGYLADKLEVGVESASSFLEVGPCSFVDSTRLIEIFKLLVASAKQTESFVHGCRKDAWIQAALTLTNVSEYVSSLGFNLKLCRIALSKVCACESTGCLTLIEVCDLNKAEAGIVERKASLDVDALLQKVISKLNSLDGENRDLASHLLQRLLRFGPNPNSNDGSLLDKLFDWVKSGEQLGRGASAAVHKATWLGTQVAKKTFDGSENEDFEKEVKILSQLCHPNITSMFCYAKNKRNCAIIMELMDGNLHELMQKRCGESNDFQQFPILEAVDIMLQIGEGVNYLHGKMIVHRDLKSMNILVKTMKAKNEDIGYVHAKVTDFGLSKTKDKSTTFSNPSFNAGTNRWMPPEIMSLTTNGRKNLLPKYDNLPKYPFKCDTYSFGMVCYEILGGCVPFSNIHSQKEIKKRVMENGERPSLPNDCPLKLKALIERCWSQEPKERPTFADICLELKYLKYLLMKGMATNRSA